MQRIKKHTLFIIIIAVVILGTVLFGLTKKPMQPAQNQEASTDEKYWRAKLSPQQYYVLHENGTDIPFTSPEMLHEKRAGTYVTADCGEPVFRSEQKYDSGTGWPSFWAPVNEDAVLLIEDNSEGITRVEVRGKKCNTHLGHVFDDGPKTLPDGRQATGKRFCINASALKFVPDN